MLVAPASRAARRPRASAPGGSGLPGGIGPPVPRRSRELGTQYRRHVDLHPDRAAVTVVRRPVGAPLESPDVAERAAVGAAHVRVERPPEPHSLDAVQRAPAGLFAILHA